MAATSTASNLGLVPKRRLGALLAGRRALYGYDIGDMARRSMGRFSEADLLSIEAGQAELDDVAIEALSLIYEFNSSPPRAQRSKLIVADDEDLPAPFGPDEYDDAMIEAVLERYIALLYLLRNMSVGEVLPLRSDDLEVLAGALGLAVEDTEVRLSEVMTERTLPVGEQVERMRRRLVVPAAGLLVGPTPAGMLVLVK